MPNFGQEIEEDEINTSNYPHHHISPLEERNVMFTKKSSQKPANFEKDLK